MIINETVSSPVITNTASAPSKFKIKASAKAFKILSGFYSEPILAIPRELGANAWDSHVKAGNTTTMFEVHAPNTLEPWFSIRDFGTGLSQEAIDSIYTTYFESTKTQDNDSDGCMGLGSKTPFNYTENFNVTSWHRGMKHIYNCFIDEAGSPNIMHITSELSKEHSGLEVKFGVKISDITMWVDKITRAYEPFRYRPTIKGVKIEYPERKYIYSGKNWGLRETKQSYYNRSCNAFMGNYCYPINESSFSTYLNTLDYAERVIFNNAMRGGGFDLFFNIGDLEVAPNKEQLQYDENNKTVIAVVNAIKNAVAELREIIKKDVKVPATLWEAMSLHNKYNNYNSSYNHIRSIIGDISIQFNGNSVTFGMMGTSNVSKNANCLNSDGTVPALGLFHIDGRLGKFKRTSSYHAPYEENTNTVIFYTNSKTVKKSRVIHYLNTNYSTGNFPTVYIVLDEHQNFSTVMAHKKYFGWADADLKNIESLPKPPPVARTARTANSDEIHYTDVIEFSNPKNKYPTVHWSRKSENFTGTGTYYYVDFCYTSPVWDKKDISDNIDTIFKVLVDNKLINGTTIIYGINAKNKKVTKVGNWVNVVDLVKNNIVKNKNTHEQTLYIVDQQRPVAEKLCGVYQKLSRHVSIITGIKNEDTRKMFQNFMKNYGIISKTDNDNNLHNLYRIFGIKAKKHVNFDFDFADFNNTLKEKYLGVFDLAYDYYTSETSALVKIINFIDEKS